MQYLDLPRELSRVENAQQKEAGLQNLKTLLLLEISLLHGCNIEWARPGAPAETKSDAMADARSVLTHGGQHADSDCSDEDNAAESKRGPRGKVMCFKGVRSVPILIFLCCIGEPDFSVPRPG